MENEATRLCSDDEMAALIDLTATGEGDRALVDALATFPADPRLHFLEGSLAAAARSYESAKASMRHAVELAPGYAIARFQLGLLLLSSGEQREAEQILQPLLSADDEPLRCFAEGLIELMRDRFAEAVNFLQRGVALNKVNASLNRDMNLLIETIHETKSERGDGAEPLSAAQLLLHQSAISTTRH